jgi:oligoribonuclease (3'-5' exoribonuclease)
MVALEFSAETVKEAFQRWRQKIERNPQLWKNGWSVDDVRVQVREFADYYGTQLLKMIGG